MTLARALMGLEAARNCDLAQGIVFCHCENAFAGGSGLAHSPEQGAVLGSGGLIDVGIPILDHLQPTVYTLYIYTKHTKVREVNNGLNSNPS